jgi:hypothetical protein
MKTKVILTSMVLLLGRGLMLQAQDITATNSSSSWWNTDSTQLYRAQELDLDGFGFGTVDEHSLDHLTGHRLSSNAQIGLGADLTGHRLSRNGQIGLGAGLDYFFLRYVGVEVEGYSESTHHTFVNDYGANLVLRYPIGDSGFAPYVFGGGGHQNEPVNSGYGDSGGGLEYRFTNFIGVFADARWVLTERSGNYGMGRVGVRFAF